MLQGLYNIESLIPSGETSYIAEVTVNPEDDIFNGHFPGRPILPGVCSLAIIKECACRVSSLSLRYYEMPQCKFTGMVDPLTNNRLTVKFSLLPSEIGYTLNCTVENGERVVMKLKSVMMEEKG